MKNSGSRKLVLTTTSIAAFVTPFLSSAIAFAVPRIGVSFHLNFVQVALIPMVFLIPLASFMILFGRISDNVGRIKVFRIGLAVFSFASIAVSFSSTYASLIAMVFLAGLGSAVLSTNSTAIVSYVYSSGGRGFALGINAMSVYLGLTFAPFLGGVLIEFTGWRSVFLFSGPLGIADLALSVISMRNLEIHGKTTRSGILGASFLAGAIMSITAYVALGDVTGFIRSLYLLPVAAVFLALFAIFGTHGPGEAVPAEMLKGNRTFAASNFTALLNYLSTFSIVFIFSIYLQVILHVSPFMSGILILPEPVLMVALSPVAGKLSDRFGSRLIASAGMVVIGISFFGLYFIHPLFRITILFLLGTIGIGFGLFSAPNTNSVMGSVSRDNSGTASGFLGTMRFTGQLFSIVLATMIISAYIPRSLIVGMFSGTVITITPAYFSSFSMGFRTVMLISAVLSIAGAATSLLKNRGK
ncbi:MAG: MFS transporter [Candidatus Thermoplasmatota archaeon]|nr:MFS transporter [Candidatus Thermoplasmatota archaeon]